MKRFLFLVAICAAPAMGQGLNQPARITGRVVSADTGHPIRGAMVQLTAGPQTGGGPVASILTSADGAFEFLEKRVGRYGVQATKAGYVSNIFGGAPDESDSFDVLAGRQIARGTIRLHRASVISGRVMDQSGDPIEDASVVAFRIEFPQPGIGAWQPITEVLTNDLGEYRIHGLMPGQYYVSAGRSPLTPELYMRGVAQGTFISTGRLPASVRSRSEPVIVDTMYGGETGGMNLTLNRTRLARVSGTLRDSHGHPVELGSVALRPLPSAGAPFDSGGAQGGTRAGEFIFINVPVGDYRLTATADIPKQGIALTDASDVRSALLNGVLVTEYASMSISVAEDISNLTVVTGQAKAPSTVTGRVFIDGVVVETATRLRYVMLPARQQTMLPRSIAEGSTVSTWVPGRLGLTGIPGQFSIKDASGVIVLRHAGPPELSLKSVMANGADVTDGFEAQHGMTVDVHLTAQGPVLRGLVKDADGNIAPDRDVVLFSAEPAYWRVPLSRRVATARTDDKGVFHVTGLPAGQYVAVAVMDLDRAMWADPDRLERLRAFATPFSLSDAALTKIDLVVKR